MTLEPHVALLVLLAALLHAAWNALIKAGRDQLWTTGMISATGSLAALAAIPFLPVPAPAAWVFIVLSTVIHTGYYLFLVQAYRAGDLGLVYPVARGTAPLLVAGLSALAAGEILGPTAMAGLVLVSAGIISLAFARGAIGSHPGAIPYALATGLMIAGYMVTDGLGVRRAGTELGYIAWLFLMTGLPITAITLARRRHEAARSLRRYWRSGLAGGLLQLAAYGLAIWAMSRAPMAAVSALRETSVIFAAVIGTLWLAEPFGRRRMFAAALVAAGGVLLHGGI